jgi:thioredoxin-related protein
MRAHPIPAGKSLRRTFPTLLAGLALLAISTTGCAAATTLPQGQWFTAMEPARAEALATSRPMLVMISTEWCPPCKQMKKDVFPTREVQQALAQYVPVYIDAEDNEAESKKFEFDAYPTFFFLDRAGEDLGKMAGGMSEPAAFARALNEVSDFSNRLWTLRAAIAREPDNPMAYINMGNLLSERSNLEAAEEFYRQAAPLDADGKAQAAGYVAFVDAFKAVIDDPEKGNAAMADFIDKNPAHPRAEDAQFVRCLIPLNGGQDAEARALIQQYLAKYPEGRFAAQVRKELEMLNAPAPSAIPPR